MSDHTTPSILGGDPEIGETFVQGKDRDTARALLAAARDLDYDESVIRVVGHGFIVPNAVFDLMYDATATTTEGPSGLDF